MHAALDALIADVLADTGEDQVDLMGHSLGTTVSQTYLATPARAANVAHYVNIDGGTASAPPGGVPTLALWAGAVNRPTPPQIVGATNITIPDQEHVEVASSEESFREMYKFLRGKEPLTTHILPEIRPRISGRATNFPQNTGLDGATLEIWLVDGDTGERIGSNPRETFAIGPDGNWGPFKAWFGLHYELALVREGQVEINYYYEPFLRSDTPGAAERGRRPRALHHVERQPHRADGRALPGVLGRPRRAERRARGRRHERDQRRPQRPRARSARRRSRSSCSTSAWTA